MKIKQFVSLSLITALVTGCATPPMFVSASTLAPEQVERIRASTCEELLADFSYNEATEKQMADDMAERAAKQLLLNTLAVGTMAIGGFGMVYHVRGEGGYRDRLAYVRGQLVALRAAIAEKGCRPPPPSTEKAIVEPTPAAKE